MATVSKLGKPIFVSRVDRKTSVTYSIVLTRPVRDILRGFESPEVLDVTVLFLLRIYSFEEKSSIEKTKALAILYI